MTVSGNFHVDIRPYSGYDDPALPIGSWLAEGGLVGDASGGTVRHNFFIMLDGEPLVSELYNLESMSYDTSSITAREVEIRTVNMDNMAPNRPATDRRWRFRTEGIAGVANSALDFEANLLPLWMGAPNRNEGDSGWSYAAINIDLLLYFASCQGYIWGPRSILAPGGPRRPVGGGLFGA